MCDCGEVRVPLSAIVGTAPGYVFRGTTVVRTTVDAPGAPDQEATGIWRYFLSKARPFNDGCYRVSVSLSTVVAATLDAVSFYVMVGPDPGQGTNGSTRPATVWAKAEAGPMGIAAVSDFVLRAGGDHYRIPVPYSLWGVWGETGGSVDAALLVVLIGRCRCDCGHETNP